MSSMNPFSSVLQGFRRLFRRNFNLQHLIERVFILQLGGGGGVVAAGGPPSNSAGGRRGSGASEESPSTTSISPDVSSSSSSYSAKEDIRSICNYLDKNKKDVYMIANFTPYFSDFMSFCETGQAMDFFLYGRSAENFFDLLRFCFTVHQWVAADTRHVAVLAFCPNSPDTDYAAMICACYLIFVGMKVPSGGEALSFIETEFGLARSPLRGPSQETYCQYFYLLFEMPQLPNIKRLNLVSLRLYNVGNLKTSGLPLAIQLDCEGETKCILDETSFHAQIHDDDDYGGKGGQDVIRVTLPSSSLCSFLGDFVITCFAYHIQQDEPVKTIVFRAASSTVFVRQQFFKIRRREMDYAGVRQSGDGRGEGGKCNATTNTASSSSSLVLSTPQLVDRDTGEILNIESPSSGTAAAPTKRDQSLLVDDETKETTTSVVLPTNFYLALEFDVTEEQKKGDTQYIQDLTYTVEKAPRRQLLNDEAAAEAENEILRPEVSQQKRATSMPGTGTSSSSYASSAHLGRRQKRLCGRKYIVEQLKKDPDLCSVISELKVKFGEAPLDLSKVPEDQDDKEEKTDDEKKKEKELQTQKTTEGQTTTTVTTKERKDSGRRAQDDDSIAQVFESNASGTSPIRLIASGQQQQQKGKKIAMLGALEGDEGGGVPPRKSGTAGLSSSPTASAAVQKRKETGGDTMPPPAKKGLPPPIGPNATSKDTPKGLPAKGLPPPQPTGQPSGIPQKKGLPPPQPSSQGGNTATAAEDESGSKKLIPPIAQKGKGTIPPLPSAAGGLGLGKKGALPPPPGMKSKQTGPRMKSFFWKKLDRQTAQKGIWGNEEGEEETTENIIDEDFLKEMFEVKEKDKNKKESEQAKKSTAEAAKKSRALNPQRQQNIGIVISKLKKSPTEIAEALLRCDANAIDVDLLDTIAKICPEPDEMKKLEIEMKKGEDNLWHAPERTLYEIGSKVPNPSERIHLWRATLEFEDSVKQAEHSIQVLRDAVECLGHPKSRFIQVLRIILAVGNFMNRGTQHGDALGFRLENLGSLSLVKAADGKTSMLEVVVLQIKEKKPELLSFPEDLKPLELARKIPLSQATQEVLSLSHAVQRMKKSLATAEQEKVPIEEEYIQDGLISLLSSCLQKYGTVVSDLLLAHQELKDDLQSTLESFGEDPTTVDEVEIMNTILSFCKEFSTCAGNLAKKK